MFKWFDNTERKYRGTIALIMLLAAILAIGKTIVGFLGVTFLIVGNQITRLTIDYYFSTVPLVFFCIQWLVYLCCFVSIIVVIMTIKQIESIKITVFIRFLYLLGFLGLIFIINLTIHETAYNIAIKIQKDFTVLESKITPSELVALKAKFVQIKTFGELLEAQEENSNYNRHQHTPNNTINSPQSE